MTALYGLPSLQQLQTLDLLVPTFGKRCSLQVAQLGQLTELRLSLGSAPVCAAADLLALSRLRQLKKISMTDPPAVQAASAAAAGPCALPQSLTYLHIEDRGLNNWGDIDHGVSAMAYWVTHLPGCPQLQYLDLEYWWKQHSSAHPARVVSMCAAHTPRLRTLVLDDYDFYDDLPTTWGWSLPGLPDAEGPAEGGWHPDEALASLTELECLHALGELHISSQADWQQLAQLRALTDVAGVHIHCAPLQEAVTSLGLLELHGDATLGGHDLKQLLLAFPNLKTAGLSIRGPIHTTSVQPAATQPSQHPSLCELKLRDCFSWGSSAAAAAQLGPLGGILAGVSQLTLTGWPCGYCSNPEAWCGLPDLSAYTGLVGVCFGCSTADDLLPLEQEDLLSMLRPLVQLTSLHLMNAPRVNARIALPLQPMLPGLKSVRLDECGGDVPLAQRGQQQQWQAEQRLLAKVKQLLKPGLVLCV